MAVAVLVRLGDELRDEEIELVDVSETLFSRSSSDHSNDIKL
jgi:hypothetical protein